jgi:hypothetical protein
MVKVTAQGVTARLKIHQALKSAKAAKSRNLPPARREFCFNYFLYFYLSSGFICCPQFTSL